VTGVARGTGLNMAARFAGGGVPIVAAGTSTLHPTVVERNGFPIRLRSVTGIAARAGLNMVVGLTAGCIAIVATLAGSRNARMIEVYRLPGGL